MAAKVKALTQIMEHIARSKGFDRMFNKVRFISGGDGKCVCKMVIEEEHTNGGGTLHGGMTASLVDTISTVALMTTERARPGVSVDLSVSYMKAGNIGQDITIEANTVKCGKTLAFLTVDLKNDKGDIIAQGKHTKYII